MSASTTDLKVLTYNLWGIFNSRMREARMIAFAEKIRNYDVILLQEQFSPEDFDLIIRSLPRDIRETRYFRRFPSGFYGSGTAAISRFPIRSAFFHTYPLQGYPEMVLHGDFFANKGCALIHLDVPVEQDGAVVNHDVLLYSTHLVAVYQKVSQLPSWKNERYLPYRISQAIALADFVRATSKPTDEVIIGGDFNSSQRSLEVQILLILLKRHGYRMRSVLPTPGAMLEHATSTQAQEAAHQLFTFSTTNAFNASKTSYFKLLNMQSDLPAQIDHIFFNASSLSLQPFHDCPDADRNFPFEIQVDEHTSIPSGVVVFTKNTVAPPPATPLRVTLSNKMLTAASHLPHAGAQKQIQRLAATVRGKPQSDDRPSKPHENGTNTTVTRYPMSDHYGVAARLRFRTSNGGVQTASPVTDALGADVLSEDERAVLNSVTQYLEDFVTKLRRQVTIARWMAGVSLAAVALHVYLIARVNQAQTANTAAAMRELCLLTAPKGAESAGGADDAQNSKMEKVKSAVKSVVGGVKRALARDAQPGEDALRVPQISPAEFQFLAHRLSCRPLWARPVGSAAIVSACAISGFSSVAIGTFQRAGNANILEEQVRLLRVV